MQPTPQHLACSRLSINICWMNEQMHESMFEWFRSISPQAMLAHRWGGLDITEFFNWVNICPLETLSHTSTLGSNTKLPHTPYSRVSWPSLNFTSMFTDSLERQFLGLLPSQPLKVHRFRVLNTWLWEVSKALRVFSDCSFPWSE